MKPYKIIYSSEYDKSLADALNYIIYHYGDYNAAVKLAKDIKESVNARSYTPTSFVKHGHGYYVINIRNRQIFYTVDEKRKIMTVEFICYRGWNG